MANRVEAVHRFAGFCHDVTGFVLVLPPGIAQTLDMPGGQGHALHGSQIQTDRVQRPLPVERDA
jgi:hypothetical protein